MSALILKNIIKRFSNEIVLNRVNLDVGDNEIVALLGESGSGKSTLLRIIAGFEMPDEGLVKLNSKTLVDNKTFIKPENRKVGLIFQDYALFPHLTVRQNLAFGLQNINAAKKKQILEELLNVFELKDVESKKPNRISGGQQQRVSIARALAVKPDLLLMDEPFSNLDQSLKLKVRKEILKVKTDFKTPMLLVTHDPDDALQLADRVAILHDGEIIQFDTPENVYNYPNNIYVGSLFGECNQLENKIFRPEAVDFSKNDYSGTIVGINFTANGYLIEIKTSKSTVKALVKKVEGYNLADKVSFGVQ